MEAVLPDWSSGSNGQVVPRSAINPIAALCRDCGRGAKRPIRLMSGLDGVATEIRQRTIAVAAGADIVVQGERNRAVYIICDGWAIRHQRLRDGTRQILDVLLPGDTIALASVLDGASLYSVQALTAASLCVLNGRQIVGLLKTNPGFAFGVLRDRLEEERRIDARITMLGRMSAAGRVGYFCLELRDRLRRRGMADATKCPFPLRRADLADAVGLSKVHVMRALRDLRSQALMEINRRDLLIPDAVKLADHTGYLLA
jgi:CRP-like cAMP-binding protein